MADLATVTVTSQGVTLQDDVAAASGGDTVEPGALMLVTNAHATLPRTVTLVTPEVRDGNLTVQDRAVVVAALTTELIRVPASATYKNVDGLVNVTYSDSAADLTVLVVK